MDFVASFAATQFAGEKIFLVSADNGAFALAYAKRFENVAFYWANGVGRLKSIRLANPGERARMEKLSDFEARFPSR